MKSVLKSSGLAGGNRIDHFMMLAGGLVSSRMSLSKRPASSRSASTSAVEAFASIVAWQLNVRMRLFQPGLAFKAVLPQFLWLTEC